MAQPVPDGVGFIMEAKCAVGLGFAHGDDHLGLFCLGGLHMFGANLCCGCRETIDLVRVGWVQWGGLGWEVKSRSTEKSEGGIRERERVGPKFASAKNKQQQHTLSNNMRIQIQLSVINHRRK